MSWPPAKVRGSIKKKCGAPLSQHASVDNMVDAHCVRDEGSATLHWLVVAFHWVRVRVYIFQRVCQPCCRKSGKVPLRLSTLVAFFFAPLVPSPPAWVRASSSSSRCCFCPYSNSYHVFLFGTYRMICCSSSCITLFRTPVVCLFPFVFSLFYGLACFVVFSYPVGYYITFLLLCFDQLRLLGLLCLIVVTA